MIDFPLLAETTSSAPYLITILSVLGSGLVLLLSQLAGKLYRNDARYISATVWKMALYDEKSIKLRMMIENETLSVRSLRQMTLIFAKGKEEVLIARQTKMPLEQGESHPNLIYGDGESGYILRIEKNTTYNVVVEFDIVASITDLSGGEVYLTYIDKKNKRRAARISLSSDSGQVLHFKTRK